MRNLSLGCSKLVGRMHARQHRVLPHVSVVVFVIGISDIEPNRFMKGSQICSPSTNDRATSNPNFRGISMYLIVLRQSQPQSLYHSVSANDVLEVIWWVSFVDSLNFIKTWHDAKICSRTRLNNAQFWRLI